MTTVSMLTDTTRKTTGDGESRIHVDLKRPLVLQLDYEVGSYGPVPSVFVKPALSERLHLMTEPRPSTVSASNQARKVVLKSLFPVSVPPEPVNLFFETLNATRLTPSASANSLPALESNLVASSCTTPATTTIRT